MSDSVTTKYDSKWHSASIPWYSRTPEMFRSLSAEVPNANKHKISIYVWITEDGIFSSHHLNPYYSSHCMTTWKTLLQGYIHYMLDWYWIVSWLWGHCYFFFNPFLLVLIILQDSWYQVRMLSSEKVDFVWPSNDYSKTVWQKLKVHFDWCVWCSFQTGAYS